MAAYSNTLFETWPGWESQWQEDARQQSPAELLVPAMGESADLQCHSLTCSVLWYRYCYVRMELCLTRRVMSVQISENKGEV